jgi:GGDEF domain-containing protein/HAMP domain-containing protein
LLALNPVFPRLLTYFPLPSQVLVGAVLTSFGLFFLKRIVDSVLKVHEQARAVAQGDLSVSPVVSGDDEIAQLSEAIGQLTRKVKDGMDQLRIYGGRVQLAQAQMERRGAVLKYGGELAESAAADTLEEEWHEQMAGRLLQITSSSFVLFFVNGGEAWRPVASLGFLGATQDLPALEETLAAVAGKEVACFDRSSCPVAAPLLDPWGAQRLFVSRSAGVLCPAGLIIVGYRDPQTSSADDEEVAEAILSFSKMWAQAREVRRLRERVRELEVIDPATGLFTKRYIAVRLQEDIARCAAEGRPCAFVVLKFGSAGEPGDKDLSFVGAALQKAAQALREAVADPGRLGRLDGDSFGIVLPGRDKEAALGLAQEWKVRCLQALRDPATGERWRIAATVVDYATDGADVAQLFEKVREGSRRSGAAV